MSDWTKDYARRAEILQKELAGTSRDDVENATDWRDRLNVVRRIYRAYGALASEGLHDWMRGDPYEIAEWNRVMTPIEKEMWCEIRAYGLPMWPQFPVGKFVVDFGNPILRIAIECDGKEFHNVERDFWRDQDLKQLGWTVFRAEGWKCNNHALEPEECDFDGEESFRRAMARYEGETLAGVVNKARKALDEYRARNGRGQVEA